MKGCLSYERFQDGAVEVYDRHGNLLCFFTNLGDSEKEYDRAKREATRFLVSWASTRNSWDMIGIFSQDLPFIQLEERQMQEVRRACAYHGTLPTITQTALADALGVTRQAILGRIDRGSLDSIKLPQGKVIPLDALTDTELFKVHTKGGVNA